MTAGIDSHEESRKLKISLHVISSCSYLTTSSFSDKTSPPSILYAVAVDVCESMGLNGNPDYHSREVMLVRRSGCRCGELDKYVHT